MKKLLASFLSVIMLFSLAFPAVAATEVLSDDIVILYTNDVHTYIDGDLSYDVISAVKKDLQKQYKYVLLADAGDHIQGTAYGSMDKGATIIEMMNAAKYDVATLGNHEFDYGMEGCLNTVKSADFPYVSVNFYHEENGKRTTNVLDGFVTFECGDEKIAFIGITTPETFEKSTSAYFQDENGNFIYGISGGKDGAALRADVQSAIDEAKKDGATKVIALGHLGIDSSSSPWTSRETILSVSGLDAFIDGHSHSTVKNETINDKDGNRVLLTQTGSYFDRIGIMVIDSDTDEISTDFIECEDILSDDGKTPSGKKLSSGLYMGEELIFDKVVKAIKDKWLNEIDSKLGEKIGSTELIFDNYDSEGNRLVRSAETNTGDFAADALYYLFDSMDMPVDAAIMNGGGVRNTAVSGEISYKTCKDIHTFGNVACLQTVTGKMLLDALEWGARQIGTGENGGFLQVSGITYKINPDIPNTVKENEIGTWTASPDAYRVYDVMVYNKETNAYEPLDTNKNYNLAGYNYTLRNLGDGYAMFDGAINILDYVKEDYMVIADYVKAFANGVIDAENSPLKEKYPHMLLNYQSVNGSGRIEISSNSENADFDEISVGGVKVTKENMNDVFADGGSVKYDPTEHILTLTNAEISSKNSHAVHSYGINLTIKSEGKVTVCATDGCGVYVEGDGFGETGNLVITGSMGDITAVNGCGILADGNITIKGNIGNISATGDLNCGISSYFGNVVIDNTSTIGNITSENHDGIAAEKDIIISGKTSDIFGGGYSGIRSTGGDIHIDGTVGNITGSASGIESYASENGGGNIAFSGKAGNISGESAGIYSEGYLNISGSAKIYATDIADDFALSVSAGKEIILPDESDIIKEPDVYELKSYETEDSAIRYTIFDGSGKPAKSIKFESFQNSFSDVNPWDWYYKSVAYVTANKLMNGVSETEFAPNELLTRAMLVTVLYRAAGEPSVNKSIPFSDVSASSYYASAVSWAKQNGIISGVSETEFAPNDNITREQTAAILLRYAEFSGVAPQGAWAIRLEYADTSEISDYAVEGIMYCTLKGIMNGKSDNMLEPRSHATRAEISAILQRFIEAVK